VQAEQAYAASEAALEQAKGSELAARLAVVTAQDNVRAASAQLKIAEQNLSYCKVTAPADGFVTVWEIREGTYVVPMPFAAAGTFVETSHTMIVASFPGQMLVHVKPGQNVELAFKSRPGRLFRGKVHDIIEASGEGQYAPEGKLPSAAAVGSPGYLAVLIALDDPATANELAMGTAGTVAIYTNWGKPFAMISKVAIRMQKWLYFLPLPSKS